MEQIFNNGVYPTMITPYDKNENIDYNAVEALVDWYYKKGCAGIFASCQSSEIMFLSLADRVKLAAEVVRRRDELYAANGRRMTVIASGHISTDLDEQREELRRIAETGVDAVVLITNRFDIQNTSDEKWISDAEYVIAGLPENVRLGVYECPKPYRRLLTDGIIEWIKSTGRFEFIKDVCCNASMMKKRLKQLEGSGVRLFDANAQTLLETLRAGAYGFCGVMSNVHPELYVNLCETFADDPDRADRLQAALTMCAFTEFPLCYPILAKYYLNRYEGVKMELFARSADSRNFGEYEQSCADQLKIATDMLKKEFLA